jgi:hypothetical protein
MNPQKVSGAGGVAFHSLKTVGGQHSPLPVPKATATIGNREKLSDVAARLYADSHGNPSGNLVATLGGASEGEGCRKSCHDKGQSLQQDCNREVSVPAEGPRCSGALLPFLVLWPDGRRALLCSRCRRWSYIAEGGA